MKPTLSFLDAFQAATEQARRLARTLDELERACDRAELDAVQALGPAARELASLTVTQIRAILDGEVAS